MTRLLPLMTCLLLVSAGTSHGQHPWQEPPERDPASIERIVGSQSQREPSRDLKIVWVWGVDKNHDIGGHEYVWVMDRFVNTLLPEVPRVEAVHAMYFPTDEQWHDADLVVFYLQTRDRWGEDEFARLDAHQTRGGGLVFLHLALLQGSGGELAKRIGLEYGTGDSPNGPTKWGPMPTPVTVTATGAESPLLERFPPGFDLVEELYWNLEGDASSVSTLVTSQSATELGSTGPPQPAELDGGTWPVMWTFERDTGRVFATGVGHNYFSFNDPYFRIILLRGMAWTMRESFDPFKPLVTLHLDR